MSIPVYQMQDQWTDGAITYTAIGMDVTNSASAAGSSLLNLSISGVSQFRIGKAGDAYFPTNGLINFGTGNYTITHSTGNLTLAGGPLTAPSFIPNSTTVPSNGMYLPAANTLGWAVNTTGTMQLTTTALSPISNDLISIGTATLSVSDVFVASGGVLNWNNGNYTITHSAGLLTTNNPMVIATSTTTPIVAGGTGAASTLILESTSGAGTTDAIIFKTATQVESMRIDNAQRILHGSITSSNDQFGGPPQAQFHHSANEASLGLFGWNASAFGSNIRFNQSRSNTIGTQTIVQNGDQPMGLSVGASNGTSFVALGELNFQVDGVPSATSMPGRMLVKLTPAGTTTQAEAMRIDNGFSCVHNNAAIATGATTGFLYIASCAGTPTGTPTTYTGRVPMVYDTTNNKFYIFNGGAWKGGTTPGAFT